MQSGARDTGWFTSTRSTAGGANCVEVRLTEREVAVRDSKNRLGPTFTFSPTAWHALLTTLR